VAPRATAFPCGGRLLGWQRNDWRGAGFFVDRIRHGFLAWRRAALIVYPERWRLTIIVAISARIRLRRLASIRRHRFSGVKREYLAPAPPANRGEASGHRDLSSNTHAGARSVASASAWTPANGSRLMAPQALGKPRSSHSRRPGHAHAPAMWSLTASIFRTQRNQLVRYRAKKSASSSSIHLVRISRRLKCNAGAVFHSVTDESKPKSAEARGPRRPPDASPRAALRRRAAARCDCAQR